MTLEQLAAAYELRCSGLCWKKVAASFGVDELWLARKVRYLCKAGIKKGAGDDKREPGRKRAFDLKAIHDADLYRFAGFTWPQIGEQMQCDHESLRRAWLYAKNKGMIQHQIPRAA